MISAPIFPILPVSWQAVMCLALIGLIVGSFLNVLILRLPVMMTRAWEREMHEWITQAKQVGLSEERFATTPYNLFFPRSHCPQCSQTISPAHLLPVIGWVLLRGRCAVCQTPISLRYPFIELLTAFLSGAVALNWGLSATALGALILIWTLIALAFIDIDTLFLPDKLTQPLIWVGLILNASGFFVPFEEAFWGAVWGYLSLWVLYWLFRLLTGKEGVGQGDLKLLAALGAWLGWQSLPAVLLIASLTGAAYGLFSMVFAGHSRQTPIPFGPFLALSGLVVLFFPFISGALFS